MPARDPFYGPGYELARVKAFRRTGGICAFCGMRPATDAHHWAPPDEYPEDWKVRARDLTPLCRGCHVDATLKREWCQSGSLDAVVRRAYEVDSDGSAGAPSHAIVPSIIYRFIRGEAG